MTCRYCMPGCPHPRLESFHSAGSLDATLASAGRFASFSARRARSTTACGAALALDDAACDGAGGCTDSGGAAAHADTSTMEPRIASSFFVPVRIDSPSGRKAGRLLCVKRTGGVIGVEPGVMMEAPRLQYEISSRLPRRKLRRRTQAHRPRLAAARPHAQGQ